MDSIFHWLQEWPGMSGAVFVPTGDDAVVLRGPGADEGVIYRQPGTDDAATHQGPVGSDPVIQRF